MSTDARRIQMDDQAARHWAGEVSNAAQTFERRWTWAALKRINPDLHTRLLEQRNLFDKAVVTGTADEMATQGAAMCRGYAAVVRAMEGAGEPDDAYVIGKDPRSGFTVAIGHQKSAAERVAEVHGQTVVWVTPDEVAAVFSGLEGFKALASIKRLFPGAEIIDVRPGEPAKGDSFGDAA